MSFARSKNEKQYYLLSTIRISEQYYPHESANTKRIEQSVTRSIQRYADTGHRHELTQNDQAASITEIDPVTLEGSFIKIGTTVYGNSRVEFPTGYVNSTSRGATLRLGAKQE